MKIELLAKLVNDNGQTYFVRLRCEGQPQSALFLREMWKRVDITLYPTESQALYEWTDRARAVRSSWSNYDGICIRTHAWSPRNDTQSLPEVILSYLRENGLQV